MKEDLQRRAVVKAIIVFLSGVLIGMYIGIMHSNAVVTVGFIIAGLVAATVVYVVNRPRNINREHPRLD
ncbi:hypothetical protein [Corynebacterium crudilactis]|uniref:Uncharacterized protein n=1 Tax=Corynebacterium crudilactis TaxID=1652495 RepID=A0A172QWE4_9CORY|nr:hypothetical protein [Corynebacterium crudilactis]ANE04966.1 hypothetical protein ccrud_12670 [Corynebacterium crudilactis]